MPTVISNITFANQQKLQKSFLAFLQQNEATNCRNQPLIVCVRMPVRAQTWLLACASAQCVWSHRFLPFTNKLQLCCTGTKEWLLSLSPLFIFYTVYFSVGSLPQIMLPRGFLRLASVPAILEPDLQSRPPSVVPSAPSIGSSSQSAGELPPTLRTLLYCASGFRESPDVTFYCFDGRIGIWLPLR